MTSFCQEFEIKSYCKHATDTVILQAFRIRILSALHYRYCLLCLFINFNKWVHKLETPLMEQKNQ